MTSQAETIRDLLFDNWSLGGELSKEPLDNMKEIVYFIDRKQVEGNEQTKVITVEKINAQENEGSVAHPTFTENTDKYVITLYYRVVDVQQPSYSTALDNIEQMAIETQRIIKLEFDPSTSTGPFFVKNSRWEKLDMTDQAQPQLERKFYLTLTSITSEDEEVFTGVGGLFIFDTSESEGDNLPASDYVYTELQDLTISEGFEQIPYLTKDIITNGRGIPFQQRGIFSGEFMALIRAKRADISGTTADKIYNLIQLQLNAPLIGQSLKAVFLHTVDNNEPTLFTTRSFMKINRLDKLGDVQTLISFRLRGTLFKPTEIIII